MRRISAVAVIAAGMGLIVLPLLYNLFTVAPAFERLMNDFRPLHADATIEGMREDATQLLAVEEEYTTHVAPSLGAALGLSPEAFEALVETEYADVATGIASIPEIAAHQAFVADVLETEQGRFASADAIPTRQQGASVMPWMLAGSGALMVLGGIWMLRGGTRSAAAVATLGVLVVGSTFALAMPRKAADTDQMNANLDGVYTAEMVKQGQVGLATLEAMGMQLAGEMLPEMATRMGLTPQQLLEITAEEFPVIAAATTELATSLARNADIANRFDRRLTDYETAKVVPLASVVWVSIVLGGVVVVAAAAPLVVGARQRREATKIPLPDKRLEEAA